MTITRLDTRQLLLEHELGLRVEELDALAARWLDARAAGLNPDDIAAQIARASRRYRKCERALRKGRVSPA